METLHLRGLKGYATLNTLVFSDELAEFARVVEAVADGGRRRRARAGRRGGAG